MNPMVSKFLAQARESLEDARTGLEWANSTDFVKIRAGIKQAITCARSSTWALQKLKNEVTGFDAWYKPHQDAMKAMKLFGDMNSLRTFIEHEGMSPVHLSRTIRNLTISSEAVEKLYPRPHVDAAFFISDSQNRSGWLVPDGKGVMSGKKYFVNLEELDPNVDIEVTAKLRNMSPEHSGQSAQELLTTYLDHLETIVVDAEKVFLN